MFKIILASIACMGLIACGGTSEPSSSSQSQSSVPPIISSVTASSDTASSDTVSSDTASSNTVSSASSVVSMPSSQSVSSSNQATTCSNDEVQAVFTRNNCMLCHNATIFAANGGGLNLGSATLGKDMLDKATIHGGQACANEKLIDQASPQDSLLLKLVNADLHTALNATSCQRQAMPQTKNFMPEEDFSCLSSWVKNIAETEVAVDNSQAAVPFDAVNAAMALTKVKYMLHGGAPTKAELDALGGANATVEPDNLKSLIEGWESTPEYKNKIERFFKVAFQMGISRRTQRHTYFEQLGKINRSSNSHKAEAQLLINSLDSMYTRTAWNIYNNERPFTDVVTSRTWRVNTYTLATFANTDSGKGKQSATGGTPFSASYQHFIPSDYTDWRTVTIEQSNQPYPYNTSNAFLKQLRDIPDGGTIQMRFPRVGFFSNPAFLGTWATNIDNQFRVTAQQTMIVALDKTFDPSDPTSHLRQDGIPEDHADPSTVCYQCHRHMDTMRLVFLNTQNIYSHATEPGEFGKPTFSFFGVSKNFNSIDEFADIVAKHPAFPAAWIQKLCMWGNSQRCDAQDSEFKRIVRFFKNNDFNYRLTVREFFSSPLFTAAKSTKTHETTEYIVSLSRGDHLCSALDVRLNAIKKANGTQGQGLDVCPRPCDEKKSQAVCQDEKYFALVPPDTFNRAETDFVQVTRIGAFDTKSLDLKCAQLTSMVLSTNDKKVINVNSDKNKTIKQLVQTVMGLPSNHPRYNKTLSELKRIYEISSNTTACTSGNAEDQGNIECGLGLNKLDAMKNTFFAACTSPDLLSVGM